MLRLHIKPFELFDNELNEFISVSDTYVELEHSLASISKWESIWKKPFLSKNPKTTEESISYIECMCLTPVDKNCIRFLSSENRALINEYLEDKMTATWFRNDKNGPIKNETITSEVIYYWMIETGIPFECDKWHINRLLTLIKVCSLKMANGKKMSNKDILKQNRQLNAARRAKLGSKG